MTTRQRIEKELRRLQKLARQSRAGDTQPVAKWWTVDGKPTSATTPTQVVSLGYAEVDAMERTRLALLGDPAYEHLGRDAEGALKEFVTDLHRLVSWRRARCSTGAHTRR